MDFSFPKPLIKAFQQGEVVLFVGAGLSAGAGLKGWIDFICSLVEELGEV